MTNGVHIVFAMWYFRHSGYTYNTKPPQREEAYKCQKVTDCRSGIVQTNMEKIAMVISTVDK